MLVNSSPGSKPDLGVLKSNGVPDWLTLIPILGCRMNDALEDGLEFTFDG